MPQDSHTPRTAGAPLRPPPLPSALTIPVVLGSVRAQRQSARPALLLAERLAARGYAAPLLDLRTLDLPVFGQRGDADQHAGVLELQRVAAQADAMVWLTPEYNHSFTSAVKNAVDFLHRELRRKPVAVCGLSGGGLGGARAVEQLKLVLIELHAVPIRDSVYFSDARGLFDANGHLLQPAYVARIDDMLAELIWYAQVLTWGRDVLPPPARSKG
ncbi:MAG: NAD(P)H-dependent oxidoreductase [Chloroflexi bacterium]|nr:NAD(P)H-dependent oxidoreductase [Chloroflexota bacterium]